MEYIISALVLLGSFLTLVASIGVVKLPDFFSRLHGPTKATTLGVGFILLASIFYYLAYLDTISLHEALISIFLFITAPISAHLMSKAAIFEQGAKVSKKKKD